VTIFRPMRKAIELPPPRTSHGTKTIATLLILSAFAIAGANSASAEGGGFRGGGFHDGSGSFHGRGFHKRSSPVVVGGYGYAEIGFAETCQPSASRTRLLSAERCTVSVSVSVREWPSIPRTPSWLSCPDCHLENGRSPCPHRCDTSACGYSLKHPDT
jgi:hypothetical protein